jgi:putative flippase GtrA
MTVKREILGYGVIGLFITLLYGVVLAGFVEVLGLRPFHANAISFLGANLLSYFLQSHFVFQRAFRFRAYLRFFSSYLLSYFVTLVIAYVMEWVGVHYLLGYLLIVVLVPFLNFALLKRWVFRCENRDH